MLYIPRYTSFNYATCEHEMIECFTNQHGELFVKVLNDNQRPPYFRPQYLLIGQERWHESHYHRQRNLKAAKRNQAKAANS